MTARSPQRPRKPANLNRGEYGIPWAIDDDSGERVGVWIGDSTFADVTNASRLRDWLTLWLAWAEWQP